MGMGRKRKHNKGLPPRVYMRGPSYYFVDVDGKWHKLGKTKAEMFTALARLVENDSGTMSDWFDRYEREELPKKAASTRHDQEYQLTKLRQVFGKMRPEHIMKRDIAAYLDQYPSPIQANRHIALLSHVFTKLIRWGVVEDNPCKGVEKNKSRARDRYVTDAEFWAVHEKAPAYMQILMELALCTGQRQGDLIRLQWSDVQDDGIHFAQSKTGKRLIVTWSPSLRAVVKRARAGVGGLYVVRKPNGKPYTSNGVRTAWQRLMQGWEGERFTFHDIRAKSASDHETGEHLGHDVEATLKRVYRRKPKTVRGL